jgi:hypothetical protein
MNTDVIAGIIESQMRCWFRDAVWTFGLSMVVAGVLCRNTKATKITKAIAKNVAFESWGSQLEGCLTPLIRGSQLEGAPFNSLADSFVPDDKLSAALWERDARRWISTAVGGRR